LLVVMVFGTTLVLPMVVLVEALVLLELMVGAV
jgi:hypothetical protein